MGLPERYPANVRIAERKNARMSDCHICQIVGLSDLQNYIFLDRMVFTNNFFQLKQGLCQDLEGVTG